MILEENETEVRRKTKLAQNHLFKKGRKPKHQKSKHVVPFNEIQRIINLRQNDIPSNIRTFNLLGMCEKCSLPISENDKVNPAKIKCPRCQHACFIKNLPVYKINKSKHGKLEKPKKHNVYAHKTNYNIA